MVRCFAKDQIAVSLLFLVSQMNSHGPEVKLNSQHSPNDRETSVNSVSLWLISHPISKPVKNHTSIVAHDTVHTLLHWWYVKALTLPTHKSLAATSFHNKTCLRYVIQHSEQSVLWMVFGNGHLHFVDDMMSNAIILILVSYIQSGVQWLDLTWCRWCLTSSTSLTSSDCQELLTFTKENLVLPSAIRIWLIIFPEWWWDGEMRKCVQSRGDDRLSQTACFADCGVS